MPKGQYVREGHATNFRDLSGQRFGKRVVLNWNSSPVYRGKKGSSLWDVRCDCGKESAVTTSNLKSHLSCGCDLEYTKRSGKSRRSKIPRNIRDNHGHRRRCFKMSPEDFESRRDSQNNQCGICGEEFIRTPHVDHDHFCCAGKRSCGKCIRGLLCHKCNTALGNFQDSIYVLEKAIAYLKQYEFIRNPDEKVNQRSLGSSVDLDGAPIACV